MGSYDFHCKSCDHEFIHEGDKLSCMDVYDEPCPSCGATGNIERGYVKNNRDGYSTATIDTDRLAFKGHSSGFKELLSKIHEGTPGSQLDKKM